MKKLTQIPPILIVKAINLWLKGNIHFPKDQIGLTIKEKEDYKIFRKVIVNSKNMQSSSQKSNIKGIFSFQTVLIKCKPSTIFNSNSIYHCTTRIYI